MINFEREISDAFDQLHNTSSERTWIYGRLGYKVSGTYIVEVQNKPGVVYVSMGIDGDKGLAIAENRCGADTSVADQRVKMRRENGQLLIREAEVLAAGGSGGVTQLVDLTDVGIVSPTTGDSLLWDGTAGLWVNGTASSITAHALNGVYHTGTLDDAQAPQFLKTDGSRNLTGNLTVAASVTIDGVDLSAHVADPDAHHNHATSGNSAIYVDGPQAVSVVLATGSGLAISSGLLVDVTHNFTWTGTHQFNSAVQMHADLNFISADRKITSGSGIDLTFDLGVSGNADLILDSDNTFRSSDYADTVPIAGFSFFINSGSNRQLTINSIKSDELHTRLFVADMVRIDIGEERWGKSMGILHDDFTTPGSLGGTVSIYFEDNPQITGALFSTNDWILFRYLDDGSNFAFGSIWGQVASYTSMGNDSEGRGYQRWTFTLRQGATSQLVKKGNVAISYGASGQGYVHLSTLQSADGPWIQIGDWSGANPYTAGNNHIRTQIGLLDGISDTELDPAGYGLYSDNAFLHGAVRTAESLMDDAGMSFEIQTLDGTIITSTSDFSRLAWWDDLGTRTGTPKIDLTGYVDSSGALEVGKTFNRLDVDVSSSGADAGLITLFTSGASIRVDSRGTVTLGGTVNVTGNLQPSIDVTYNLGGASKRWATVYADNLVVSTSISGATIGGAIWTYAGSMTIDATGSGTRTISVTNSGAGSANLDVDQNITLGGTIDGVDLSGFKTSYDAHIANANAHHNQMHVLATGTALGPDHTISGAAAGEVLRALSATTAAFDVLQHSDLGGISANQHHNQSHVLATGTALGADHTISGAAAGEVLRALSATTAAFDVLQHDDLGGITANQHHNQVHGIVSSNHTGTGATLSVVGFSATNTLDVLVPSSDVGTTPVAALLKSTSAGGLGLASMFTSGAVDVGQGATFGNDTIRMIYHTHGGVDHTHMVINPTGGWSLDEQFGLDIDDNLLVRGWIVGKHAIQVANAVMLVHYDGPPPAETNFVGETAGHLGQVGSISGGAIFREGKFGKAILTGEATTNLIANPSFETNTTGWTGVNTASFDLQPLGKTGLNVLRIINLASTRGINYDVTLLASTTYTFSVLALGNSGQTLTMRARRDSDGSVVQDATYTPVSGVWLRMEVTFTTSTAGTYNLRILASTFGNVYIDEAQCEQKAYATPYCDGSLGAGYSWSGTAHASTSSRVAAAVEYADPALDIITWPLTVMAWIKPTSAGSYQSIIHKGNSGNTTGFEMANSSGTLRATLRNATVDVSGGALILEEWNFVGFTYDGTTLSIYLAGELTASVTGSSSVATTDSLLVGQRRSGNSFNGFIDELSIISRALSADEIRAIYESGAPIFAETSTFQWRAGRNRIYADSEGLWALGASGATILGLYAGDDTNPSATKSWGGVSLSEGDFLLGRYGSSEGGWLWFDQNLVGGNPGLSWGYADKEIIRFDSGGASLYGVLDIDTNGGIYQGSGSFASPTTGLKLFNSGGTGKLSGYNGGTEQVKLDTDGKFYAGAGSVILDATGLQIVSAGSLSNTGNALRFMSGATTFSELRTYNAAGFNDIYLRTFPQSGRDSSINLISNSGASQPSVIEMDVQVNSTPMVVLALGADGLGAAYLSQASSTGAVAVLELNQADTDQPMIKFDGGTAGSGTSHNFSTDALGAYQGKIQVVINGSTRWVPYYL